MLLKCPWPEDKNAQIAQYEKLSLITLMHGKVFQQGTEWFFSDPQGNITVVHIGNPPAYSSNAPSAAPLPATTSDALRY